MTDVKISAYSKMRAAITDVIAAQKGIRATIAADAQRHEARLEAQRKDAEIKARIDAGIARKNR